MSGFIYNVTTNVQNGIHAPWLKWMREEHIPQMIATGCFTKAVILRLRSIGDSEGQTYAVQYYTANEAMYTQYLAAFSAQLRAAAFEKWGDQTVSFRTFMEVVN